MSFGQFILGLVTIFVATFVYRWQKMVDRETAVQAELRGLCAQYVSATKEAYLSQPFRDQKYTEEELNEFFSIGRKEKQIAALRDQIILLAPADLLESIVKYDKCFRNWKILFPTATEMSNEKILAAKVAGDALLAEHNALLDTMRSMFSKQHNTS